MQYVEHLCQQPFVNWRGETRDTGEPFAEQIAEVLLQEKIAEKLCPSDRRRLFSRTASSIRNLKRWSPARHLISRPMNWKLPL